MSFKKQYSFSSHQSQYENCNSDLDNSSKLNANDAIILYALVEHSLSSTSLSFSAFFDTLVDAGEIPNINISALDFSSFSSDTICYDYDQSGDLSNNDVEILSAFVAYMQKITKSKIDSSDSTKFLTFLNVLETQGLYSFPSDDDDDFADDDSEPSPIMLPTILSDDKIYLTDGIEITKSTPSEDSDDFGYDYSNSEKGSQVDSNNGRILIADSGVSTLNKWNGVSQPSVVLKTGLVKIGGYGNDEEKTLHIPINVFSVQHRPLYSNFIQMGSVNAFNSKTIAINSRYAAVSWHMHGGGLVYIYDANTTENEEPHTEIIIDGDFSAGLPVLELCENTNELFVTNSLDTDNHSISVYELTPNNTEQVVTITSPTSVINKQSTDSNYNGFGSSMVASNDGNYLFVGDVNYRHSTTGNIDLYDTDEINIPCGAVQVFKKNSSSNSWVHLETIIPNDLNEYIAKDFESGASIDLQFGYSIAYIANKLFIGSPRSHSVSSERREGAVYVYTVGVDEFVFDHIVTYDDAKFDTTSILNGNFNFGLSITGKSNLSEITIVHQIPQRGTFASQYKKINGKYEMEDASDFNKVSDQSVNGMVVTAYNDTHTIFGGKNILESLE